MNHNSLPMSLTGLKNHDRITWNRSFSFFGDGRSEAFDQGKRSIHFNFFPLGTDGVFRRCHDVYHGAPCLIRKKV